jgi:neutral ceramidase
MHHAGLARTDITVFEPGITLMGWGLPHQQARGVTLPLHARALVLGDGARTLAYVTVELLAVSRGLWMEVCEALRTQHPSLGLAEHNVAIVATHTHSGPSGYAHSFWMQLNAPGFSAKVHDTLVAGIVDAIVAAHAALAPATLVVAQGEVPREAGVAFNRSWFAYSQNHDTDRVPFAERDQAVHRTMTLLRIHGADGKLRGVVDWFGLHNTCVHGDNDALHSDHKGLAATALEDRHGIVALFAQECCGDISPNFRPDPTRAHTTGLHDDDHKNALRVADAQVAVAESLLHAPGQVLSGPIEMITALVDLSKAPADARFTVDGKPHTTRGAVIGISMALGTAEGRGPLWPVRGALAALHGARRALDRARGAARKHDPLIPFVDLAGGSRGKILGLLPVRHLPPVDPVFRWIRERVRTGDAGQEPWMPPVLPVQLIRVGGLVVATVPNEPTTVSGRRLRDTLRAALPDDVHTVVISPYANAYAGYLTTAEEYQVQHYEAGYTIYGPHTLAALQTVLDGLAERVGKGLPPLVGALPTKRSRDALERMAFKQPWPTVTALGRPARS